MYQRCPSDLDIGSCAEQFRLLEPLVEPLTIQPLGPSTVALKRLQLTRRESQLPSKNWLEQNP